MTARQIIAPTTYGVTVAEAKQHSKVLHDAEDGLVELYLAAAVAYAERTTGQPFESQTWEAVYDAFPDGEIELSPGPCISVTAVTYVDENGDIQTVDPTSYEIDTASHDGWLVPSDGWPTPMETINAIRVVYVTGAGAPPDVKQAIILLAAHWYSNREAVGPAMQEIPLGVETILSLHRRYYV